MLPVCARQQSALWSHPDPVRVLQERTHVDPAGVSNLNGQEMGHYGRKPYPFVPPCGTFRRAAVSSRGPGQSRVLPFACCVWSLCSGGRCGLCS